MRTIELYEKEPMRKCLIGIITKGCHPRYWTISGPRKVDPHIILSDSEDVGDCYYDYLS